MCHRRQAWLPGVASALDTDPRGVNANCHVEKEYFSETNKSPCKWKNTKKQNNRRKQWETVFNNYHL